MSDVIHKMGGSWRGSVEELSTEGFLELATEISNEYQRRRLKAEERVDGIMRGELRLPHALDVDARELRRAVLAALPEDAERQAQMWMFRACELEKVPLKDSAKASDRLPERVTANQRFDAWQLVAEELWRTTFSTEEKYTAWRAAKEKAAQDKAAYVKTWNSEIGSRD